MLDVYFQPKKGSVAKLLESWQNERAHLNMFWKVEGYLLQGFYCILNTVKRKKFFSERCMTI